MDTVDLGQLDAAIERQEAGLPLPILGMDGKLLGLTITIAGPDSERARKARAELHDDDVAAQRIEPRTAEEEYERGSRFLAKLTIGWSPNVKLDGEDLSYSEENATLVYSRYRIIRQQVDAAAGNRAAFMPASPSSSATPSVKA